MIKYNTIEREGDYIILDFELEDKPYYSSCVITGVRIDTPLTYDEKEPYHKDIDGSAVTHFTKKIFCPNTKKELLIIKPYVYLAELPLDIPCGADIINKTILYNEDVLHSKGINYLKELGDNCIVPKGFIDFILTKKAFDLSVSNCNYDMAIKYWNLLTNNKAPISNKCGCNGR